MIQKTGTILVADDDAAIRTVVGQALTRAGYDVRTASNAAALWKLVQTGEGDLIVTEVMMPDENAFDLIPRIRKLRPQIPIVVMSAQNTFMTAIRASERGAYEYLPKPFDLSELTSIVGRALAEPQALAEPPEAALDEIPLVGRSPAMQEIYRTLARLMHIDLTVLINGESGTGKELVARALHDFGKRKNGPFVAINAASIAPDRMESEIFGEEGPDGRPRKIGVFEQAHAGTLLLDEVGDMPVETQSKILRVLVEQRFRRLGGSADVQVNVRVISSSSRELRGDIERGRFREDLFHRLNVVPLRVPSLAERRDDIPELAQYFVLRLAEISGLAARDIGPDAMAALQAAEWPGNVRQLRNVIERILILAPGDPSQPVTIDTLPQEAWPAAGFSPANGMHEVIGLPLRDARERFEREYLSVQIMRFGGNISRTAHFIGMERSALHRKLKSLGVEAPGRPGEVE